MAKKIDVSTGIGDITDILNDQGVADLSWLNVSEADYRALETLPKQNLDMIPELSHALTREPGSNVPFVIPIRPNVIVNQQPSLGWSPPRDTTSPVRDRVSRLVMAGHKPSEIQEKLSLEFSNKQIQLAGSLIKEVIQERGLLGNVYINSAHFPRCSQGYSEDKKFVASHAKEALFILAKDECAGCVCARGGTCSVFKKRITSSIPYDDKTLSYYSPKLASEGKTISKDGNAKVRLRMAFLDNPRRVSSEPVLRVQEQHHPKPVQASEASVKAYLERAATPSTKVEPLPSPSYMAYARRMMAGANDTKILTGSPDPDLRKLAGLYGILGHTYLDMDVLGGCRNTVAFVKKYGSPDFIIRRRAVCEICKGLPDGGCAQLCHSSRIVSNTPTVGKVAFLGAVERAVLENRLTTKLASSIVSSIKSDSNNWGRLTATINLFKPGNKETPIYEKGSVSFFHGSTSSENTSVDIDPEEIRRFISHLMNTGMRGQSLTSAVLSRYTKSNLSENPTAVRSAAENNGIQGFYYIDPTAYNDYGHGCTAGSSQFRKRGAKYILASSSCTGCVLQTSPGWCSKYAKEMIRQVPESVKADFKKKSLPVIHAAVENPVEKYQLDDGMNFDVSGSSKSVLDINISHPELQNI
jgi:hypothetical protein